MISYWESLVYSLILITISAWFVLIKKYLSVILVFLFTVVFIGSFTKKTFEFVINQELLIYKIKRYLKHELNKSILIENRSKSVNLNRDIISLKNSCLTKIKKGQIIEGIEELEFLRELLYESVLNSRNPNNSAVVDEIIEIIKNILEELIFEKNLIEVKTFIKKSYKKFSKIDTKKYNLDFYFGVVNLLKKISDLNQEELKRLEITDLLDYFYENPKNNLYWGNLDSELYITYFYVIKKNNNLNEKQKFNIYERVLGKFIYNDNLEMILKLLKTILDEEDINLFAKCLNYVRNMNKGNKDVITIINLSFSVYFYYIIYKEKNIKRSYKEQMIKLSKGIEITDDTTHSSMNIKFPQETNFHRKIYKFYKTIKCLIQKKLKWKKSVTVNFHGRAKTMQMHYVIKEFFIFYSIVHGNISSLKSDIKNNLSKDSLFIMLNDFFYSDGKLKNDIEKEFYNFLELYGTEYNENNLKNKVKKFYGILSELYKEKFLSEISELRLDRQKIKDNFELYKNKELRIIKEIPYLKLSNNDFKYNSQTYSFEIRINSDTVEEGNFLFNRWQGHFKYKVLDKIEEELCEIFEVIKLENYNENKVEIVKEKINQIEKKGYKVDSVFEDSRINNAITNWYSDKKKELSKLTKNLNKYDYNSYYNFYLDSTNLEIYLGDFDIKFIDIDKKRINYEDFTAGNDIYVITPAGNIKLYLSKKELKDYLSKMKKIIKLKFNLYINTNDKTGFIVKST